MQEHDDTKHGGPVYRVGQAVFDRGHPERYGRILSIRPHPEYDYWALAMVLWKKGLRQPAEVPTHHLQPFDVILEENQRLREKWQGLKDAAERL